MSKTQPFHSVWAGGTRASPRPSRTKRSQGHRERGTTAKCKGEGRGAVSLRGTGLGVKGFVGPMSILQAVNIRGLRLAGSRVLQVFREMPGKMIRMGCAGLASQAGSRVWREVSESHSEVFTTESSRVPHSAREVGSRTWVELQASRPWALRAQAEWRQGAQGCQHRWPSQPRLT